MRSLVESLDLSLSFSIRGETFEIADRWAQQPITGLAGLHLRKKQKSKTSIVPSPIFSPSSATYHSTGWRYVIDAEYAVDA